MNYLENLHFILPEVVLTATICLTLVLDLLNKGKNSHQVGMLAILGLLLSGFFLINQYGTELSVFGMVEIDNFGTFFKLFTTASLIVVILFTIGSREIRRDGTGEFYFVLLSAGLGAYFLVSTYNLLLLYLSLELLSISSYVLAGYLRGNRRSGEAALKYIIYGAVASGIMLYGLSLIFGLTGTLDIRTLGEVIASQGPTVAIALASVMALVGFGYKISAVPFHFWAPDVYEGAPIPVTTFLAVASKGVAFGALLRFLVMGTGLASGAGEFAGQMGSLLALLAAVTMTFGNLAALRQDNLKRLLAYSSIAHAGYVLVGLAVMGMGLGPEVRQAFEAAIFYLVAYYFMNLGAFGCVIYFANQTGKETLEGIRGLGWKAPVVSACLVVFLVSLTGLPPTVGFLGKWYLMVGAVDGHLLWLAVFVALNSVVSLFYYFRIVKNLYLVDEEVVNKAVAVTRAPALTGILLLFGAATIWFCFYPESLRQLCADSLTLLPR